jgi:hypothetical protein
VPNPPAVLMATISNYLFTLGILILSTVHVVHVFEGFERAE